MRLRLPWLFSLVPAFALLMAASGLADAATARKDLYYPDGAVTTMSVANGLAYFGGTFERVGTTTGSAAVVDPVTGIAFWFPHVDGTVRAMASDGAGGWYVGGSFHSVDGLPRRNLAHVGQDRQVSAWNPGADTTVLTIAVGSSAVYVAGDFDSIGTFARHGLAAIDRASGGATAWNPRPHGAARALLVQSGLVYVGGEYDSIASVARAQLAALDGVTGAATPWAPNPNGAVVSLAVNAGTLYVVGGFSTIAGQSRSGTAAFRVTDGTIKSWAHPVTGYLTALATDGARVFLGHYVSGPVAPSSTVEATDTLAGSTTAWKKTFDGAQPLLVTRAGALYLAVIPRYPYSSRSTYALDTTNGNMTQPDWDPHPPLSVSFMTLAVSATEIGVGGNFQTLFPASRPGAAAIDLTTGYVTPWNPGVGANTALLVAGNKAFLASGGEVAHANSGALRVADATTGALLPWNPFPDGTVYTIAIGANGLYVGGHFSHIGGQLRSNIAEIDTATGLATGWNPQAGGRVRAIALGNGSVFVGGEFTSIGNAARSRLAALDPGSGLAFQWNPGASGTVNVLAVSGATVYAGGGFPFVDGKLRNGLAALDASTGAASAWDPEPEDTVRAIVIRPDAVWVGGDFNGVGGTSRSYVAALSPLSGLAYSTDLGVNGSVMALGFDGVTTYLGGSFTQINGTARTYFAGLSGSPTGIPGSGDSPDVRLHLSPNPSRGPVRVTFSLARRGPVHMRVYDIGGREVAKIVDAVRPEGLQSLLWTPDNGPRVVPAGLYFVVADLGGERLVQRMVRIR